MNDTIISLKLSTQNYPNKLQSIWFLTPNRIATCASYFSTYCDENKKNILSQEKLPFHFHIYTCKSFSTIQHGPSLPISRSIKSRLEIEFRRAKNEDISFISNQNLGIKLFGKKVPLCNPARWVTSSASKLSKMGTKWLF